MSISLSRQKIRLLDRLLELAEDPDSPIGKLVSEQAFVDSLTDTTRHGEVESLLSLMAIEISSVKTALRQLYEEVEANRKILSQPIYPVTPYTHPHQVPGFLSPYSLF